MATEPNPTLYIHNLNEKLKKDALKKLLYMLFSQYGKVIEIGARKGLKMRGQAFVVFQDTAAATNAMKGKQGFKLYGKELRIEYAKSISHRIARRDGLPIQKAPKPTSAKRNREEMESDNDKIAHHDDEHVPAKQAKLIVNNTPNRILFAQNLPADITQDALSRVFLQAQGLVEVRLAPGGRGVAFVEFENEVQAGMALRQLHDFQITPSHTMHLTYSS